jgi:hypothetical protein
VKCISLVILSSDIHYDNGSEYCVLNLITLPRMPFAQPKFIFRLQYYQGCHQLFTSSLTFGTFLKGPHCICVLTRRYYTTYQLQSISVSQISYKTGLTSYQNGLSLLFKAGQILFWVLQLRVGFFARRLKQHKEVRRIYTPSPCFTS